MNKHILDSFLFSLALAVGLTPQLLPAIISINLAHGAKKMALKKVIVKRLASIENFGSMNVLCSDKTGTLTEGTVQVDSAVNVSGSPAKRYFCSPISMLFMKRDLLIQLIVPFLTTARLTFQNIINTMKYLTILFENVSV